MLLASVLCMAIDFDGDFNLRLYTESGSRQRASDVPRLTTLPARAARSESRMA